MQSRPTFRGLEGFEQLDESRRSNQIRILGGGLHNGLQILSDVDSKHLVEAFESLFDSEFDEVADQPL